MIVSPVAFFQDGKMPVQKGLEKEEREKERTFPQKVFPSRIWLLHKRLNQSAQVEKILHKQFFSRRCKTLFLGRF